jgi:hypothetical protein
VQPGNNHYLSEPIQVSARLQHPLMDFFDLALSQRGRTFLEPKASTGEADLAFGPSMHLNRHRFAALLAYALRPLSLRPTSGHRKHVDTPVSR